MCRCVLFVVRSLLLVVVKRWCLLLRDVSFVVCCCSLGFAGVLCVLGAACCLFFGCSVFVV